jgi:hypothetical protein
MKEKKIKVRKINELPLKWAREKKSSKVNSIITSKK